MLAALPHPPFAMNVLVPPLHKEERLDNSSSSGASEGHCLPKRTRVLVVGNNRTKRSLVGQEAVVKKAVGLGGWHWLVLSNGEEVKLQRNALSVLEYGPEEQDSSSDEMTEAREPQIEILTRPRIRRPPKALSPVQDMPFKRPGFSSGGGSSTRATSAVPLHRLDGLALRRYSRVYGLAGNDELGGGGSRDSLLAAVRDHFAATVVEESVVLGDFMAALRRRARQQQLRAAQWPSHYGHLADDDAAAQHRHNQLGAPSAARQW